MAALSGFREIILLSLLSILFINLCLQIQPISAQLQIHDCTNTIGNYSQNSKFQSNLNTIILSSISSDINATNGFYNRKVGDGVDQVNAVANCRGDIDIETCRGCVNDAARNLTALCPNQKEAIVWFDYCMFRYSNNSILGIMSLNPYYALVNTQNASDVNLFPSVTELISYAGYLSTEAANGSLRKFSRMKSIDQYAATVYAFMECTPDLTPGDCLVCLNTIANEMSKCCYDHVGGQWATPSCIYRLEIYPFLKENSNQQPALPASPSPPVPPLSPPPLPVPPLSPPPPGKGKSKTVIIVVCVIVVLLVLTLSLCIFVRRRQQNTNTGHKRKEEEELKKLNEIRDTQTRQYDFSLIRAATDDFSTANKLGRGGFGEVYKGVLSDGKEIAVKRLSTTSGQGENEFMNEVKSLAKLQHKCLVRLLGFCLEQTERLVIYEFMANGSLDKILFDPVNKSMLDWERRSKIIKSVARGILYLHEDSRMMIIHRDLKASNILLDEEMNAKISDFGMARLFVLDEGEVLTKRIAGTFGYMAPEYAMHGLFSVKSDVYSYGVLLLEIICGKKTYSSLTEDRLEDLPAYAYKTWKEGKASDLIDPMVTVDSDSMENMIRCIHIALLCVQENVGNRPTMAAVVHMLQSSTLTLPTPSEPGFFINNTETVAPHWSSFSDITETSSSNSQSKPILMHSSGHNHPSSNEASDSHKHLHTY